MCSNYEFPSKKRLSLLDIHEDQLELEMKTHVYPLAPAPIMMRGADEFELDIARFGLIPAWAKELKNGRHTYNARKETVASKPSFRHAWKNNQFALVPVDTFYEPKYIDGKRTGLVFHVKMAILLPWRQFMMMRSLMVKKSDHFRC